MSLLTVHNLTVAWEGVTVVRDVSFTLERGDGLALVGGSGAGKSSIALALMGLLPPAAHATGDITCDGTIGLAFQDVGLGLNPVMRIGRQVAETVSDSRARDALRDAGVAEPAHLWDRYPHEVSGGQRQRVMLAIALAAEPAVLVADEPTSALDPTLRVALLERLAALRRERQLALLLITHDLRAAQRAADHVAVLFDGRLVETGRLADLLTAPATEHARALVGAIPRLPGLDT